MSDDLAGVLVLAASGYLAMGLLFAVAFAGRLAGRLDPTAARGTWGFRLLTIPGAALLWPLLVLRLGRAR